MNVTYFRSSMSIKQIAFLTSLTFYLFSCHKDEAKQKTDVTKNIQNLDTVWSIVTKKPTKENMYEYSRRVRQFSQTELDTQKSNLYINRLFTLASERKNIFAQNLAEQNKSIQQFMIGNSGECHRWAYRALESSEKSQDIDILDVYHLVGLTYYSPDLNTDSVTKYWKKGFKTATEQNDNYRIYFFANNLGAIFYSTEMYTISRQFFLKALQKAKEINSLTPTLVNNIINSFLYEENEEEALTFYRKYQKLLDVKPNTFENQSIYLNRIHFKQKTQNTHAADSLLREINLAELHKTYIAHYISLCIQQYILTGEEFFINDNIKKEATHWDWQIIDNINLDNSFFEEKQLSFVWDILEKSIKTNTQKKEVDVKHLKSLRWLIKRNKKIDANKYDKYLKIYALTSLKQAPTSTEINRYKSELSSVEELFDKIQKSNLTIENKSQNIKTLLFILSTVSTIFILSILFFRTRIKLKKKQEEFLVNEKKMLIEENKTNKRLIEFSKELINFNKRIKSELDRLSIKGENAAFLRSLRSDILGFITVNLEQNPKDIGDELDDKSNMSNSLKEQWQVLNKTEKRIYTLIQEEFKANEIGRMLGVTTQYVYNVKTKLKRKGFDLT
jgi:hypothetical protein